MSSFITKWVVYYYGLFISNKIYKSFNEGFEVRRVFLDITKAFDKVWHEGLLLKLSLNGISGNLLRWLAWLI